MRKISKKTLLKYRKSDCWNWPGSLHGKGYGAFRFENKKHIVHRYTYEMFRGPIADNLVIDHLCRNKKCCNPYHLEAVTNKTNILRGEGIAAINSKKTHCHKGHSFSPDNTYKRYGLRYCLKCRVLKNELLKIERKVL